MVRQVLTVLLVYLLCLIQLSIGPFGPDLVLIALFVFALHENRLVATLLAFFAGLVLDIATPSNLGVGIAAYAALTYGTASLHSIVYRSRWHLLALVLAGLVAKDTVLHLARAGTPSLLPLAVSAGLTLLLVHPADRLLVRMFYPRWKTG